MKNTVSLMILIAVILVSYASLKRDSMSNWSALSTKSNSIEDTQRPSLTAEDNDNASGKENYSNPFSLTLLGNAPLADSDRWHSSEDDISNDKRLNDSLAQTDGQLIELAGQITNEVGQPLSGVAVSLVPGVTSTVSDESGNVSLIAEYFAERHYRLSFDAGGYVSDRLVLSPRVIASTSDNTVNFKKKLRYEGHYAEIWGNVLGPDSAPVSAAKVLLKTPAGRLLASTTSNFSGEYRFDKLPLNQKVILHVMPIRDFAGSVSNLDSLDMDLNYIDIQLAKVTQYGTLAGVVVDGAGLPVAGYSLRAYSSLGGHIEPVVTDQDGSFRFDAIPAGSVNVRSDAASKMSVNKLDIAPATVTTITLPIDRGQLDLAGQVVDQQGQPISGAKISLLTSLSMPIKNRSARFRAMTRSDKNGQFRFNNLGKGNRYLSVDARGYISSHSAVALPIVDESIRIQLNTRS